MDSRVEFDNSTELHLEVARYIITSRGAHNIHYLRIGRYNGLTLHLKSGEMVFHGYGLSCGHDSSSTRGSIEVARRAGFTGDYEHEILTKNSVELRKEG